MSCRFPPIAAAVSVLARGFGSWWAPAGLALAFTLASCLKVERQTAGEAPMPVAFFGEWRGAWASDLQPDTGTLVLSVQDFEGRPVLSAEIQHPCLAATVFNFRQDGLRWELSLDGEVVFVGEVDPERLTLTGSYSCTADQGTWDAAWQGSLPAIPDLSGNWNGLFESLQPTGSGDLSLALTQRWIDGRLQFVGTVSLFPDLGHPSMTEPAVLPITAGEVRWTGPDFQLLVQAGESLPWLTLQGSGTLGALGVQQGLLLVENAQLPFSFALWSAAPAPR
ncbi:MAG: hypothetical protein VYE77_11610 [Planctomycetota bacterium]|nr:hypothetical protein [Planctomycetota bacterium]